MRALGLLSLTPLALGLVACGETAGGLASVRDGGPRDPSGCNSPADAVEPMAEDRVLWPYRWSTAFALSGAARTVDLEAAHCNTDDDMDWSPFDVLLFVSIPAW